MEHAQPGALRLAGVILAIFVVGTPLVAYLWTTLGSLLSGRLEPLRLLVSIPVLGLFLLLLRMIARFAGGSEAETQPWLPTARNRDS